MLSKPGPVPAISESEAREILIPSPPFREQIGLVVFINRGMKAMDIANSRTRRENELICECRTRLFSDTVIGRVKILSINFPEVADEELFCVEGKTKALDDMIDEVAEVEE